LKSGDGKTVEKAGFSDETMVEFVMKSVSQSLEIFRVRYLKTEP
jgi:hypothetical protein